MTYDMSPEWTPHLAVDSNGEAPLGLGGLRLETTAPGAWIERGSCDHCAFKAPFERISVHYWHQPSGGAFDVFIDDERHATVDTEGEAGLGLYRTPLPSGARRVRLEVTGDGGRVALFGIRTYQATSGLEYASVGLNGATVGDLASLDRKPVTRQIQALAPDLFMFSFGSNGAYNLHRFVQQEGANRTLIRNRIERYRRQFRNLLKRYLEAAPDASCLVLLPPDLVPSSSVTCNETGPMPCGSTRPQTFEWIVDIQREIADEFSCATWDRAAAMGGDESIRTWARREPPLARDDGIHLTIRGYERLASGFFEDLSRTYAAWKTGMGAAEMRTHPVDQVASPLVPSQFEPLQTP